MPRDPALVKIIPKLAISGHDGEVQVVETARAGGRVQAWSAWLYAPRPGLRLAWLAFGRASLAPQCHEWIADVDELRAAQWQCVASGAAVEPTTPGFKRS